MKPTDKEIEAQIGEAIDQNGRYPGMSYEDGVRDALDWVLGNEPNPPLDEGEQD